MLLTELLKVIDPEQHIQIKYRGDILFNMKAKWCNQPKSVLSVINILATEYNGIYPVIIISVDAES